MSAVARTRRRASQAVGTSVSCIKVWLPGAIPDWKLLPGCRSPDVVICLRLSELETHSMNSIRQEGVLEKTSRLHQHLRTLAPGQGQGGIPGQLEHVRMIAAPDHLVNM